MENFKAIEPKELHEKLQEGSVILIDVREEDEYNIRYIEGSVNIPMSTFSLSKLPKSEGKAFVFQCLSGRRSEVVCKAYLEENKNATEELIIYNLKGGIKKWVADGYDSVTI